MTVELETDIAPATKPKRTRKTKEVKNNPAASLIAALEFVSVAQKKAGATSQQFSKLGFGWLCVANEALTIGTPIVEQIEVCPHTLMLADALSKCGEKLTIAQVSDTSLHIKSGEFEALIPCVSGEEITITPPDPNIAPCDDRLKPALAACAVLVTEGALQVHLAAVLVQALSCVATNGHAMLEVAHGIDLPPGMVMPKSSAVAIARCKKAIVGFGYSANSATFWLEDGSFIKTQLFEERYPNYKQFLDIPNECNEVPKEFFKVIHLVSSFATDNLLSIYDGMIKAGDGNALVTYNIKILPAIVTLNLKDLLAVEAYFINADFKTNDGTVYFQCDKGRGCLTTFTSQTVEGPSF